MKHRKQWLIGLLIILIIGIGGKWYRDEQEKAKLHEIQTDLANYLYNDYRIYTKNKEKSEEIKKKYNRGNGSITEKEYLQNMKSIREYSDITKIEFTGFSVSPMKMLKVHYTINNKLDKQTYLNTISAETNKLVFKIGEHEGEGPYYLEKKPTATNLPLPENLVTYDEGGIR
ncbi:TPA: hypothetical protein ITS47_001781 [Enterococcus faecalis]|uniref:hypothetical protein n=1 Tax=Enterococcus faecalis TaxID=1351 RepID=UPI000990F358|nr:hypothetical protein [Enterococcus faecalis]MDT2166004.1 hypothetical protein [Enterococcus faecalis]OOP51933.1 hypothetical protein BHU77_12175 [Enterococcus faecalis]RTK76335.1 hypothetical protein DRJ83_04190 [Enterococcus faecalis]CAG4693907.1 Uncharacterised protein [Enterococcus faecalis]HAP2923435.1 hypothetical protein [Enterococcus faecalis]